VCLLLLFIHQVHSWNTKSNGCYFLKLTLIILHLYVPLVVNTSRSFSHSLLIPGLVTRLARRMPLVDFILSEHMSSPPDFSGVHGTRSLVFCVMFFRSLFVLFSFFFWPLCCLSFDLRILITPLLSSNSSYILNGYSSNLATAICNENTYNIEIKLKI
jgi:hypothetical protein